jgi:hypothetical protein
LKINSPGNYHPWALAPLLWTLGSLSWS